MERELQKAFTGQEQLPRDIHKFFNQAYQFQEMMMMYSCAIKEVRTKFEVLNEDLTIRYKRNPIEMIKSRVKKPESIVEKLERRNLNISVEDVEDEITDVAGVRVICSFIDDIYKVAQMFVQQDDVRLLTVKDYIQNPKPNGYRSYHIIVEVPVFFADKKQPIKVEVQFRTIAMDFWASLEHQMKYKKDIKGAEEIIRELKNCADVISATDEQMQNINYKIMK